MRPNFGHTRRARRALIAGFAVAAWLAIVAPASAAPEKVAGGVRFTFTNPGAGSVSWAGDFNAWNISANPMTKGDGGTWSVVIPLPPGTHAYKFSVDGQWVADPENPVTSGDYGNNVVQVAADGAVVAQKATANTPYSTKILVDGRVIGWFTSTHNSMLGRWETDRPWFNVDLGFGIKVSDILSAKVLFNVDPLKEDVQDYRSRLNYQRGELLLTRPKFSIRAFDSELIGTWDDPLHLVGNIGPFAHPFGWQHAGVQMTGEFLGLDGELQFSDNVFDRNQTIWPRYRDYQIDNFPTFVIGPADQPRYVFETDPIGKALSLLQTERAINGFGLVQNQAAKVSTLDFGDGGERFGVGDAFEDVFAARVQRDLGKHWTFGALARSDRGFNFGRMVLAESYGDSTVRLLNTLFNQQWYGGGLEAGWHRGDLELHAEALGGSRRLSFVNGSQEVTYPVDSLLATKVVVDATRATSVTIDGDHRTTDASARGVAGGSWTFAQGDVVLRGGAEYERHQYPAWTQEPIAPPGLPPDDHPRFETVEFQREHYLDTDRDLVNTAVTGRFGWDRNWRYYLNREVKTKIDVDWTAFDYDPRTSWEHQFWFPTGNFWLESGGYLVTVDRLTFLGEEHVIRFKPTIEIPIAAKRDVRLEYRGNLSTVALDVNPRYLESRFLFGFDLTHTLRFNTDTRWVKYDAPTLGLGQGYVSGFAELFWHPANAVEASFGYGVDPRGFDPVTNEYADIGRDQYIFERNANGFTAETNYLSLAPQIAAAEQALQDQRTFQVRVIVKF